MKEVIEKVKANIRGVMLEIAKLIDMISNGWIRAWHISIASLLGHVFVLMALTEGLFIEAAILLAGFGLLDALDGAMARYQNDVRPSGMFLDSVSDRFKEMLIYIGLAFYFSKQGDDIGVMYSVLALGMSYLVSYIKAKGEVILLETKAKREKADINREFEDGIGGYEVRMFLLFVFFLLAEPFWAIVAVASVAAVTALTRYQSVIRRIR